jgi:cysteinyl-tRNA synthetase
MTTGLERYTFNPEPDNLRRWAIELRVETIKILYNLHNRCQSKDLTPIKPSAVAIKHSIAADRVEAALAQRSAARAQRDWATADALRDQLVAFGVEIQDTGPGATRWRYVS